LLITQLGKFFLWANPILENQKIAYGHTHLSLRFYSCNMDPQRKKQLQEFFTICYARLNQQEESRAERFRNLDLYEEITQELADVANYAFLEFLKMTDLRSKADRFKRSLA
jgi:hypothetical protein